LVIGAGMAGLSAAIRASDFTKRVILVDKGKVTRSGVSMFCHAFGAPLSEDVFEPLLKEIVQRSGYLGDQTYLEILLKEISERFRDMERWGVVFEKDEKGNLKRDTIRGQKIKVAALAPGKHVIETLAREARRRGVEFVERVAITDLLTSDGNHPTQGHVVGAVGLHTRTGQFTVFRSRATVVTTGGISAKLHTGYMDNVTGDGYAMAFRAGAEIGGMEFSPTFAFSIWNRKFSTGGTGQFQHGGTRLVNRLGEEFLRQYPAASKELVAFENQGDQADLCRAITVECLEGRGPVYFDMRAWSQEKIHKMRKVLPFTMMAFDEAGVNIKEQMVETTPMPVQYGTIGQSGAKVNTLGESTVTGLYAAGAACMNFGGGVLTQASSAVGGYRAGENAARQAGNTRLGDICQEQVQRLRESTFSPLQRKDGVTPGQLYYSVNRVITAVGASLFKHEERIKNALREIRRIANEDLPRVKADDIHQLVKANEAKSFTLLMELYNISSLERKESRGVHYREDYPYTDNLDWRKWILLKNSGQGVVRLKIEPVPLGCHAIEPEVLSKAPSPVPYRMR